MVYIRNFPLPVSVFSLFFTYLRLFIYVRIDLLVYSFNSPRSHLSCRPPTQIQKKNVKTVTGVAGYNHGSLWLQSFSVSQQTQQQLQLSRQEKNQNKQRKGLLVYLTKTGNDLSNHTQKICNNALHCNKRRVYKSYGMDFTKPLFIHSCILNTEGKEK